MTLETLSQLDRDHIALIRAFTESARELNFTVASSKLGLTPSTLGRRIKRLEQHLGVDLFIRTTRRVALTEAGTIYLNYCTSILTQLEEADVAAACLGQKPVGLLRVSVPSTFGKIQLTPALPKFLKMYPEIQLDIDFTDHFVDLVEQRIDVAIRIGVLPDSTLKAKLLATNVRRLVAAPTYLKSAPPIKKPEDLKKHRTLHFSYLSGNDTWCLEKNGNAQLVSIRPYMRSNDASALYEVALSGHGIALLANFITKPALKSGKLVQVLNDWSIQETGIYALYAKSGFLPTKTRVFINFVTELFKNKF